MKSKKSRQKFTHIAIHPETKETLNEIGRELAKKFNKKSVSYDEIETVLIKLYKGGETYVE